MYEIHFDARIVVISKPQFLIHTLPDIKTCHRLDSTVFSNYFFV